eukprot:scaffold4026_cov117-Cylindrotheca_fusiformis.AAC.5
MRSRLFVGENDDFPSRLSTLTYFNRILELQPPKVSARKFGTKISINNVRTPSSQRLSTKKLVKVRRHSSGLKSTTLTEKCENECAVDKTIVFSPGPVGLQLEPLEEDPTYGCRVVRFVDGGPKSPGQARTSGLLKPGDLVVRVEAGGIVGTTYKEIIQILKDSCAIRRLTFRSVWESTFLDSRSKLDQGRFEPKQEALEQHVDRSATPNAHNLTSEKKKDAPSISNSRDLSAVLPPVFPDTGTNIYPTPRRAKKHDNLMDITLIRSPSHIALLPHVRAQSTQSMPSQQEESDIVDGPMIIHLPNNGDMQNLSTPCCPPSPPTTCKTTSTSRESPIDQAQRPPRTLNYEIVTAEKENNGPKSRTICSSQQTPDTNAVHPHPVNDTDESYTDEDSSIISTPAKVQISLEQSQLFSPSGIKSLAKRKSLKEARNHAIVSRVFGMVYNSIAPIAASSSNAATSFRSVVSHSVAPMTASLSALDSKVGYLVAGDYDGRVENSTGELKLQVLQELNCAKLAMDVHDVATEELERNMNELAHEKVFLRADFEKKLDDARLQHVS